MKCLKGFLTAKDKETKKEIPFFVKVRSKDIVVTTPIKIESYLYKTSNDYDLVYEYHGHDYSQYVFKTTRDSTNMQRVMYKLFRDGTMNINLEFLTLYELFYLYMSGRYLFWLSQFYPFW